MVDASKITSASKPGSTLVHNHPSSGSFSGGDMAALLNRDFDHMVAVGHNGTMYRLSVTENTPTSEQLRPRVLLTAALYAPDEPKAAQEARDNPHYGIALHSNDRWQAAKRRDYNKYAHAVVTYKTMTQDEAWHKHSHEIMLEMAKEFNLDYQRVQP